MERERKRMKRGEKDENESSAIKRYESTSGIDLNMLSDDWWGEARRAVHIRHIEKERKRKTNDKNVTMKRESVKREGKGERG